MQPAHTTTVWAWLNTVVILTTTINSLSTNRRPKS
jgi:hypothetical protein